MPASSSSGRVSQLALGKTLFEENCSSCHGADAQGSALAPNLQGLGAATVDLWVSSGWMPLAEPGTQPIQKPNKFTRAQTVAIANWVGSLAGGPGIPKVDLAGASVAEGFSVFALNCAPCHTITGAGDALSNGIVAPSLHGVTKTMIAEAVRTGPGNMPRFATGTISNQQLRDVAAYVTRYLQHPVSGGKVGLGGVGPVAEGFVGLFVGVGLCVLAAFWIGDRTPRETDEHGGHGHDLTQEPGTEHA
jgi:ubiquinol-cytochrome c reductase cytochrome c subunit